MHPPQGSGVHIGDSNAAVGEVLSPKTFYATAPPKKTGTMPTVAITNANDNYPAGYHAGDAGGLDAIDLDLASANIKSGVTIFGKAGAATVQEIGAADAAVADVLAPKTFFSVTGGIKTGTKPQSFYDGFEYADSPANHGWTLIGSPVTSADQAHSGSKSLKTVGNVEIQSVARVFSATTGHVIVYFYDDGDATSTQRLIIYSGASDFNVGIDTTDIAGFYAYYTGAWVSTGIARAIGWHCFIVNIDSNGLDLYVDGVTILTNNAYMTSFTQVKLQAHTAAGSTGYWDDLTINEGPWFPASLVDDTTGSTQTALVDDTSSTNIYRLNTTVGAGLDVDLASVTPNFAANSRAVAVGIAHAMSDGASIKIRLYMNGVQVAESAFVAADMVLVMVIGTAALSGAKICKIAAHNYAGSDKAIISFSGAFATGRALGYGIAVGSVKVTP